MEETTKPSIEDRLTQVEETVSSLQKKSAFSWTQAIELLSKVLLPLVLFVLALIFKDSVQYALESKRFEVQSAGSIEKLLLELNKSTVAEDGAHAAAVTLSAYGEVAVMPLISILENGSTNAQKASKRGLFLIGLSHPKAVTEKLLTILGKRQGQFRWQTHYAVIELLGKIAYPDAKNGLIAYKDLISAPDQTGIKKWESMVQGGSPEGYQETMELLEQALARIDES